MVALGKGRYKILRLFCVVMCLPRPCLGDVDAKGSDEVGHLREGSPGRRATMPSKLIVRSMAESLCWFPWWSGIASGSAAGWSTHAPRGRGTCA